MEKPSCIFIFRFRNEKPCIIKFEQLKIINGGLFCVHHTDLIIKCSKLILISIQNSSTPYFKWAQLIDKVYFSPNKNKCRGQKKRWRIILYSLVVVSWSYPLTDGDSQSQKPLDIVGECERNPALKSCNGIFPFGFAVFQLEQRSEEDVLKNESEPDNVERTNTHSDRGIKGERRQKRPSFDEENGPFKYETNSISTSWVHIHSRIHFRDFKTWYLKTFHVEQDAGVD